LVSRRSGFYVSSGQPPVRLESNRICGRRSPRKPLKVDPPSLIKPTAALFGPAVWRWMYVGTRRGGGLAETSRQALPGAVGGRQEEPDRPAASLSCLRWRCDCAAARQGTRLSGLSRQQPTPPPFVRPRPIPKSFDTPRAQEIRIHESCIKTNNDDRDDVELGPGTMRFDNTSPEKGATRGRRASLRDLLEAGPPSQ